MAFIDPAKLYPLLFSPIYVPRIWGGTLLTETLGREVPQSNPPIGESWELVDRADHQSAVKNGALSGNTLESLVKYYGRLLIGAKWNGHGRFPLLIKLLTVEERLSLQVHPDTAYCRLSGQPIEPKTEMWYVINHRPGAKIMAGLNPRATRQQLLSMLGSLEVENCLQNYPSSSGDAYFVPAGTLHAIGEGNLLLEIQQNSDCTFRLSDWGRVDAAGNSRELHIEQGLAATNFMNRATTRIPGVVGEVEHNRKFALVNHCNDFTADVLKLRNLWRDDTTASGSFHLLTSINNPIKVGRHSESEAMIEVAPGETALVPACFGSYFIVPQKSGSTDVVRVTL